MSISIHALREEGDLFGVLSPALSRNFYPRPPRGGRPSCGPVTRWTLLNFYPRPPRGGRHRQLATGQPLHIFLSTPSARRATCSHGCRYCFAQFLSTPSARRATIPPRCFATRQKNFYPRPPRGGRRAELCAAGCGPPFLSTPSARRATPTKYQICGDSGFLSTPSARRATPITGPSAYRTIYFYPRPPRGGRLFRDGVILSLHIFLSTPSARRATELPEGWEVGDLYFYPRPPRGGRPLVDYRVLNPRNISIHALREEGDIATPTASIAMLIFLSTPSARRATSSCFLLY